MISTPSIEAIRALLEPPVAPAAEPEPAPDGDQDGSEGGEPA